MVVAMPGAEFYMHSTAKNTNHQDVNTDFILAELRGGPLNNQVIRVPRDESSLRLTHNRRAVTYSRFNDRDIFHYDGNVVAVLKGGAS